MNDMPKMRSGKNVRCMLKIIAGEGDQLGDLRTVADPGAVVDVIKAKIAESV